MNDDRLRARALIPPWVILLVAVAALVLATVALTATVVGRSAFGMMSGGAMMPGAAMMSAEAVGGSGAGNGPAPGASGFVAGTVAAPRVIRVIAGPGYAFSPSTVAVARGETVTFLVTTMGPTVHEFMVGPADAVAADTAGTPEIADIGMMATKSLTYTFDGPGPYAFACHATGHYEAGMAGTIAVVP
jgi:plastocyanin